jgi:hypothetical protein
MDEIALPDAIEPTEWYVVFHMRTPLRWLRWLALGRFKHVSAFAYCPGFKAWLVYDTQLNGTRLMLLAHPAAKAALIKYTEGCEIVHMPRQRQRIAWPSRLGFFCTPAIIHLLAVRCRVWRPDALYRHLLQNGGKRLAGGHSPVTDRS